MKKVFIAVMLLSFITVSGCKQTTTNGNDISNPPDVEYSDK